MKDINGYTRICGLLGDPVEHTMSPVIHNNLARETGENLVYVPFHVKGEHLGEAVRGAHALNLLGLNVTVPHKQAVIPFLAEIDPLAERIGAVNTLVRMEKGYKGYNTDMPGLYRAMQSDGVSIEGEEVIILGAGGVARAVAMMLLQKGAAGVILLNRTIERAARVAKEVNAIAREEKGADGKEFARAFALQEYRRVLEDKKYLAIQATSVGMFPNEGEAVIEEDAFYDKLHTGYDLIFNPARTRFMNLVQMHGGKAFNGEKMLLYQGVIAYELWTGKQIDEEMAKQVYRTLVITGISYGKKK